MLSNLRHMRNFRCCSEIIGFWACKVPHEWSVWSKEVYTKYSQSINYIQEAYRNYSWSYQEVPIKNEPHRINWKQL